MTNVECWPVSLVTFFLFRFQFRMKLFQCVEQLHQALGIQPTPSSLNTSFNLKNVFALFCIVHLFATSTVFLLFEAETVANMSDSFYVSISALSCICNLLISIWRVQQIIRLIEKFEQFIEKSGYIKKQITLEIQFGGQIFSISESINPVSNTVYVKLNATIEFLTGILHFLVTRLSLIGICLPALLITLVNYFVSDLGEESFNLPFVVVYVHSKCIWDLNFEWR